jgi:hypothetical protein
MATIGSFGVAARGTAEAALPADLEFASMRAAYQATGGIARWVDLSSLLQDKREGACMTLAALVATGDVFEFEWSHCFWVPMFQFEQPSLRVKAGPRRVCAELAREFRGSALASWFTQPNTWLGDRRPVEVLDSNLPAVLAAARAGRFVAAASAGTRRPPSPESMQPPDQQAGASLPSQNS